MYQVTIKLPDETYVREYEAGCTYLELAKEYESHYDAPIVLAFVNGKLSELNNKIQSDAEISFLSFKDDIGYEAYKRSLTLLLAKAVFDIEKDGEDAPQNFEKLQVHFHLDQGYYCTIDGKDVIEEEYLARVSARMRELVAQNLPIIKKKVSTNDAISMFGELGMEEKKKLFTYRRSSTVNFYELDGYKDYNYGYMAPETGSLGLFELYAYQEGLILQMPNKKDLSVVAPFVPGKKLFDTLDRSGKWGNYLGIDCIGDLNKKITQGDGTDIILVQEALMEKRIADIAAEIANRKDVKFVLIAGPSSSGKTTFSHRLSIQLQVHGKRPHPIAVDNYFVEREETPRDENGDYDFECLEAVDVKLFNKQMNELLAGKRVDLPVFNFTKGCKEYGREYLQIDEDDILVIEGIHCLNPKMTEELADENKYKVYISALTQLNIDKHNCIPSTDGRLLRRIIRDSRTRGASAIRTIQMWKSVRRGEEKNIFPYQEEADSMFNSTMIYELAVIKPFVEAQLFAIDRDCPEYIEAKRLLRFLDYFVGMSTEDIPKNSLVREFVGGGCFKV